MTEYKNFKTYKKLTTPKLKLPTAQQAAFAVFIQTLKTSEKGTAFREKRDQYLKTHSTSLFIIAS